MPSLSRAELVVAAVLAAVAAVLGIRHMSARAGAEPSAPADARAGARGATASGAAIVTEPARTDAFVVHVAGAVRRPGVVRLRAGARVRDALRAAGGAARSADVHAINLAAKVADGQQVVVPRRMPAAGSAPLGGGAPPSPGAGAATASAAAGGAPVNLNSATVQQLDGLDGIGPALAERIVAWRTEHGGFRSIEDLAQVPGIGPKRLEALRAAVVV